MNRLQLIGLGMGEAHLTPSMRDILAQAEVVAGGRRQLELLAPLLAPAAQTIPIVSPLAEVFTRLERALNDDHRVVAVASGDPLFQGLGKSLIAALGPERVEAHPNVSTVQAMAARLKTPWDDIRVVSLHGQNELDDLLAVLSFHDRVAAYTDPLRTPAAIARALLERGAGDCIRLTVCEDLHAPTERIRTLTPTECAVLEDISPLNMVLLERVQTAKTPLRLGMPDGFWSSDGNHTTWPVRAAALAALELSADHTLWDLGAGNGTVAVEAAALLRRGRVVAVERHAKRVERIRANARRCQAFHVRAVCGDALQTLEALPEPDRVFVGGGLGAGPELLERACARLPAGGVVVVVAVLLSTLESARRPLEALGFGVEITHIAHSRGTPLAGDVRLEAENPVFLIKGVKP